MRWMAACLTDEELQGRNTWLLWTAGDQVFWDGMAQHGLGTARPVEDASTRAVTARASKTWAW